jgi:hypothetical protein
MQTSLVILYRNKLIVSLHPHFLNDISNIFFVLVKKYAEHYSLIASRFGLPAFAHPPGVPIKTNDRTSRLRIGYKICLC